VTIEKPGSKFPIDMKAKERPQGENAGNSRRRITDQVLLYAAYAEAARDPLFLKDMESTITAYEGATADGL
jgi:hypothetical protein